jgi:nucleoside-triphosphatase THEP1
LVPDTFWVVSQELHDTNGKQVGFVGTNADGAQKQFAFPADGSSPSTTIGNYQVDTLVVDELFTSPLARHANQPIILDEIGRMQIMSPGFAKAAIGLVTRDMPLLATITYGDEWTRVFTGRTDVVVLTLTLDNRDVVFAAIKAALASLTQVSLLSDKRRAEFVRLARTYGSDDEFLRLELLCSDAVQLVTTNKIHEIGEDAYTVLDARSSHEVSLGRQTGCDCDMANGRGDYQGQAGVCPHIQAAWLYRVEAEPYN